MRKQSYYLINAITFYRLIASPVLVYLALTAEINLFKWLLAFSFFTDSIDGFLARKFKVSSSFGSKLDSIADDLTVLAGFTGLLVLKMDFVKANLPIIIILFSLFILQIILALIKYRKFSSFHTYFAKLAALLQGCFLILMFFLPEPLYPLFYLACVITALDLAEEIILVFLLPEWETDVKGIYWVMKKKREAGANSN
jgi:phosphatidylglycerophosphate synthase